LQRAFSANKCAHAYIFAGPEGVGKFTTALEWAKVLLCKEPAAEQSDGRKFSDSCGVCESCVSLEAGTHPDFHHIYKELIKFTQDGKGKTTPVDLPKDVIKEFLIERALQRPMLSERKVFVVSEAEKLNISSQNALLKILEEPPAFCTIILLCTGPQKLLPTVKSRSQMVRFGPVAEEKIIEKLKDTGIDEEQAKYFARLSNGSLGQAERWAQLELSGSELFETKQRLISRLVNYDLVDAVDFAEACLNESRKIAADWAKLQSSLSKTAVNRRASKTIFRIIISALHDAMKINIKADKELINFDQKHHLKKLTKSLDTESLARKISESCRIMLRIDSSVNERLIFEKLLLNLISSDTMI